MPNCETKFSKCFNLPNPNLRAYFGRVESGQPDEYRTPFFKGKSLTEILNGWMPKLTTIQHEWPTLYDFEVDLGKKVGPMSIMKPLRDRMDDIDAYYDGIHSPSKPISSEAIAQVSKEWSQIAGLRMKSQANTVLDMKKSTNSGSPYFTTRRNITEKTIPCNIEMDNYDAVIQYLNGGTYSACAILGWRGQEGGPMPDDVKQRVVWMFPYAVNVEELRVYQPLIAASQSCNLVPAWVGMDKVDEEITRMFQSKAEKDLVICTDFTKYDQHFNASLQEAARTILGRLFIGSDFLSWLNDVFPIKYMIPLAYNWNCLRVGPHGMGSGSGGTNADETLAHRALQHEAALLQGETLNPHSQCLGDDGILTFPGCSVDDVVKAYERHGLEMNLDKQYASTTDCTYLRRWHHKSYVRNGICVGVYSTLRALGRLAEQERYYDPDKWSKEMVALRQLSILENCKYHPLANEFVDYCMEGDKYRLGLDIPGFFESLNKITQEAIDYMPDFMGYARSLSRDGSISSKSIGINNWWIVQTLKSKR